MKFIPNPAFAEQMELNPVVQALLARKAAEAGRHARQIGRGLAPGGGDDYAASIYSDENRVGTTDRAGHLIEWGSVNNRPYAPLRKAVEQAGARYKDTGRA